MHGETRTINPVGYSKREAASGGVGTSPNPHAYLYLRCVTPHDAFLPYSSYNDELLELLNREKASAEDHYAAVEAHLDGVAYQRLRRSVSIDARRKNSTFFTGTQLRERLISRYRGLISRGVSCLDPACGAGDLLIAVIKSLPKSWSLPRRLEYAERSIHGRERIPILAEVARNRLRLALKQSAVRWTRRESPPLSNVRAGDGLSAETDYSNIRLVLLNPPFARTPLVEPQPWGDGLTSQAAPFTLDVLKRCDKNTKVAAILPDVLRSGSRYQKWREEVARIAKIESIEVVGLFDSWTDVDVFIAHFTVQERSRRKLSSIREWSTGAGPNHARTLGQIASIAIGDVVPHRHKEEGVLVPYLTVHNVPVGAVVKSAPLRRFSGRLHKPPFLVLRRTSAPTRTPGPRLAISVIDRQVGVAAVENHLIVVKPTLPGIDCHELAKLLQHESVTQWLDSRIRTRHLTKTALLDLPLPSMSVSSLGSSGDAPSQERASTGTDRTV